MHALVALDALARLGTVWEAAEELGITRSGVSHRLAMLEGILGFDLATRAGTGVVLTPRGKSYAEQVRRSLILLANAQEERANCDIEGGLRVSSTAGFSSMWLCKHIASFHTAHPNIWLQIVTASELDDVTNSEADLFIAFGDGKWPKHLVKHLYDVAYTPMCSPALLNAQGGLHQPADVLRFPLLMRRWDDWRRWLAISSVEIRNSARHRLFRHDTGSDGGHRRARNYVGRRNDVCGCLASGQLVSPFPATIDSQGATIWCGTGINARVPRHWHLYVGSAHC